ncbi:MULTISPECIES: hypothetical protein [Fructobacillus]|uniref:Uncharacterized protein n=1 Tax=Fructobacillus cardui TaxID=2893170 RepID=A0ABN9YM83_9LACO|nr:MULTISPECIES: hypothetical protein [Fructobacillus]KMK53166.1 hypothetical protein FEFB_10940 [Fructobacillus sp. EFB-N1]MCK8626694.1 hypothetical protein [Fructobacillus cardui]CAK1232462.1 unnamed protein product [Fructobacillus cardui]
MSEVNQEKIDRLVSEIMDKLKKEGVTVTEAKKVILDLSWVKLQPRDDTLA